MAGVSENQMATWKIKELRDRLEERLDPECCGHARSLLHSLDWKIRAEKYHSRVAEQAFSEHFGSSELTGDQAFYLALENTEEGAKFDYSQSVREFNLVAAVSVSHTIPEIFSQLIAAIFFSGRFGVHKITIGNVLAQLPTGEVKSKLQEIADSQEYDYFKAFTNMSKHISLVSPEYHISFEGTEFHGVRFKEFEYKSRKYPSKRDDELLSDLKSMRIRFVELGITINESVR